MENKILAPCSGEVVKLSSVNDEVFSEGILGDGFAIIPVGNDFVCPCSGKIVEAFEGGHAYILRNKDNLDILVHIGLDTVELEGKCFTTFVSLGDTVTAGGKLASVDVDEIIKSGYDPVTVVVLTNEAMISEKTVKYGKVKAGDVVCEYNLK